MSMLHDPTTNSRRATVQLVGRVVSKKQNKAFACDEKIVPYVLRMVTKHAIERDLPTFQ